MHENNKELQFILDFLQPACQVHFQHFQKSQAASQRLGFFIVFSIKSFLTIYPHVQIYTVCIFLHWKLNFVHLNVIIDLFPKGSTTVIYTTNANVCTKLRFIVIFFSQHNQSSYLGSLLKNMCNC